MPQPLSAGFPPDLALAAGARIRVTAVDPITGTPVSGVRVSDVSFYVRDATGGDPDGQAPMPLLVPTSDAG